MNVSRWHINLIGMVDFWYYGNEVFHFSDGHLLLRGSNGSGKSVTMQSFIPLLLDGNKSSERLDPFGTRSRKIENYLLEENDSREERIGYLYMEFKRADSDLYTTIGMGLRAKKNSKVDAWYFVIEDNRRIGVDIQLVHRGIALTKLELKNRLGEEHVIDSQRAYMDKVNRVLFGFENGDDYKEIISLLLQLRTPKLSNSLKPTAINDILSASLQPLSEDDLRPMSEAIANMDALKDQLDALKRSFQSASAIKQVYDQYNLVVLYDKMNRYQKELLAKSSMELLLKQINKEITDATNLIATNQAKKAELLQQEFLLSQERNNLSSGDVLRLKEDQLRLHRRIEQLVQELQKKERQKEDWESRLFDLEKNNKNRANQNFRTKQEMDQHLIEMDFIQEEIHFDEHISMKEELLRSFGSRYDFTYTKNKAKEELSLLDLGIAKLKEQESHELRLHGLQAEKDALLDQKERATAELDRSERYYDEVVEEYKEAFFQWNERNQLLKTSDKEFKAIIQILDQYHEKRNYNDIRDIINQSYQTKIQSLSQEQANIRHQYEQTNSQHQSLEREINELKSKPDVAPIRDAMVKKNRDYLTQHNIKFLPLYMAIDFSEGMSQTEKNRWEEALVRLGLLDALVVNKEDRDFVLAYEEGRCDTYLFVDEVDFALTNNTMKTESHSFASDFVCASGEDNNTLESSIMTLLGQFGVHLSHGVSMQEHWVRHGLVHGTVSGQYVANYIGVESRRLYKEDMIATMSLQLTALEKQRDLLFSQHEQIKQHMALLDEESRSMPTESDLDTVYRYIKECEHALMLVQQDFDKKEIEIIRCQGLLKELKMASQEIAVLLHLPPLLASFVNAKERMQEYQERLLEIASIYPSYVSSCEVIASNSIQMEQVHSDVVELRIELEQMTMELQGNVTQEQQLLTQLNQGNYQEIKDRLEEVLDLLEHLPKQIETCSNVIAKSEQFVELSLVKQTEQEEQRDRQNILYLRHEEIFREEFALGYHSIASYELMSETQSMVKEVALLVKNKPIAKTKEQLTNDLQSIFFTKLADLHEYHLTRVTLFPSDEYPSSRLDITAKYLGKKISFLALVQQLEQNIGLQNSLIQDQDKSLFEEILVNIISNKIRIRIRNSRIWVDRMNEYMSSIDTSSTLSLGLIWKSKKAETEEEMDANALVQLLEKDVILLRDIDKKRLSAHFRSKIDSARRLSENSDNVLSFHQIMRSVMDYRNWFEFKIMYQKLGETKKEMTNSAFFAFSGGEKAMSMYVPLFSAVAAKFLGARNDAPMLIALDEAFAGVDEKNIANMFALIGKFGFDYIMNSQILWGDYETVDSLAIYELFRPDNEKFVTVIPYRWNGHTKAMVK